MSLDFLDLPYDYDALEPHIDKATMETHYGKHHRTYFDKMTAALDGSEHAVMGIERILNDVAKLGDAVRNNAGGYYNHNLYWGNMSPDGGGDPQGSLAGEIERTFESVDQLRTHITNAGIGRFGSGFAWLILQNRTLKVVSTPNQDNPLMNVVDDANKGTPLLALDVWEHAYYLKYQNRRPDYIAAFWNVVNWRAVAARFEQAMDSA